MSSIRTIKSMSEEDRGYIESVSRKFYMVRVSTGRSVKEFAEFMGVTPLTIYKVENMKQKPNLILCIRLCKCEGITMDDLIYMDDVNFFNKYIMKLKA